MTSWNKIYSRSPQKYKYYNLHQPHENLFEVIKILAKKDVKEILDLGCGLGRNLIPLTAKGFKVTGIDNSPQAIKNLKTKLQNQKLTAEIQVGKFQRLSFPNNCFDAIICIQTLNHGYEKDIIKGFMEINRVLKPGGIIFLTLPGRIAKGKVRYCLVKTAQKIEKHTYIPTIGEETGVPHYIFNCTLIKKYLKNYHFLRKIWLDEKDYYCILAEKIS